MPQAAKDVRDESHIDEHLEKTDHARVHLIRDLDLSADLLDVRSWMVWRVWLACRGELSDSQSNSYGQVRRFRLKARTHTGTHQK